MGLPNWRVTVEAAGWAGDGLEFYIQHSNFLAYLVGLNVLSKPDASFYMVPGLADERHFSFLAQNYPDHYLRHEGFRLKLHKRSGDELFDQDATFEITPGIAYTNIGPGISFRSHNYPDRYLRYIGQPPNPVEIWADVYDASNGDENYRMSFSFHTLRALG
ncbi:AbfB domain-containing protein [Streptomyces niveus]|uniref:AbfB domain-containing protein n=1 Tax=Streptomyces niveus TaxID=193462 RepID=UPI0036CCFEC1